MTVDFFKGVEREAHSRIIAGINDTPRGVIHTTLNVIRRRMVGFVLERFAGGRLTVEVGEALMEAVLEGEDLTILVLRGHK